MKATLKPILLQCWLLQRFSNSSIWMVHEALASAQLTVKRNGKEDSKLNDCQAKMKRYLKFSFIYEMN